MTADQQPATFLANNFSAAEIRDYGLNALKVKMESGTITRQDQGSSFTISRENCEQIIADTNEALAILAATAAEENRELTTGPMGRGADFSTRITS